MYNSLEMQFTEKDLPKIAKKIADQLRPGDILVLSGPLAAGKTTLTREIARSLGYQGPVTSPTFVLERRYPLKDQSIKQIIHLDFYRLNPDEVASFDWQEQLTDPDNLTIIEWPEIAQGHLPPSAKKISLEVINEQTRAIVLPNDFSY